MCTRSSAAKSRLAINRDFRRRMWDGIVIREQEDHHMEQFFYQVGLLARYAIVTVLVSGCAFGVLVWIFHA